MPLAISNIKPLSNPTLVNSYLDLKHMSVSSESNPLEYQIKLIINRLVLKVKSILQDKKGRLGETFIPIFDDVLLLRLKSIEWLKTKSLNIPEILERWNETFEETETG